MQRSHSAKSVAFWLRLVESVAAGNGVAAAPHPAIRAHGSGLAAAPLPAGRLRTFLSMPSNYNTVLTLNAATRRRGRWRRTCCTTPSCSRWHHPFRAALAEPLPPPLQPPSLRAPRSAPSLSPFLIRMRVVAALEPCHAMLIAAALDLASPAALTCPLFCRQLRRCSWVQSWARRRASWAGTWTLACPCRLSWCVSRSTVYI